MSLASALARPEVLALEPYVPATWEPALERLHANENPWRSMGDASHAGLNRYPEPYPHALEARLAALYGVAPESLIAGRGSDEGIDLLVRAFCVPGRDTVLICPPTFGMYAFAARVQGAEVREVPLLRELDYALDENGLAAAVSPAVKLVFLCTPNNPTGTSLDPERLARIARAMDGRCLVVVDEAYAEFNDRPSAIGLLPKTPNLVVLRTLSKAYALAGARCGAVIASPDVVDLLRRIIPPYAIATSSSEATLDALEPARLALARERIARIVAERERLAAALRALPQCTRVYPSQANFVLATFRDAGRVLATARQAGFLLRDFSQNPHTAGCLRISIGTADQSERLLAALGRADTP